MNKYVDKVTWLKKTADGSTSKKSFEVIVEQKVEVSVNNMPAFTFFCTPVNLKELVIGRLYTECMINSLDDKENLYISDEGDIINVILKENVSIRDLKPLPNVMPDSKMVLELIEKFTEDGKLHKSTAGTHSCYIRFNDGEISSFEDIGRHNALDKAIGHMLIEKKDAEGSTLFTTGRIAADMVEKTVASGIPVLVSKSVPTTRAISLAREYGLKLICKAWPDSYLEM